MDEVIDLLKIKIEKAKRELPLETINAIDAVDWKAAILSLRSKYGYSIEQLGNLELETELLLAGLVTAENYPKELEKRMGIPGPKANELVNDMNDLVFKKIREELIKNTERKKTFGQKPSTLSGYPLGGDGRISPPRSDLSQSTMETESTHEDAKILRSVGIEIISDLPATPSAQLIQVGKLELEAPHLEKPAEKREDTIKNLEKPETVRPASIAVAPVAPKIKEEIDRDIPEPPTSGEAHPILAQKLSRSFQVGAVKTEHTLENITKTGSADTGAVRSPKIDPYREIPE